MSISEVTLINAANAVMSLNVKRNGSYLVKYISGLDADDIVPKFYGMSLVTKTKYHDMVLKPRIITILIQLNPKRSLGETPKMLRDELYKMILRDQSGLTEIQFSDESAPFAKISGFITKFESDLFTKQPTVTLTIRCDNPMFTGISKVLLSPSQIAPGQAVTVTDSISTAPHGFKMDLTWTSVTGAFSVRPKNTGFEWSFQIDYPGNFQAGDRLVVSTEVNNKYAYMIRGGTTYYIMESVYGDSVWPMLFPGTNTFHFQGALTFDWNSIEYDIVYWGL